MQWFSYAHSSTCYMEDDTPGPMGGIKVKWLASRLVRSRVVAALLSAMVPGIGQVYKGENWKGLALVMSAALTLVFSILSHDHLISQGQLVDLGWAPASVIVSFLPYISVWSYSVLDALLSKPKDL